MDKYRNLLLRVTLSFILGFWLSCPIWVNAQAPQFAWAKKGVGNDINQGRSIASDSEGNTFTAGYFYGSITFGTTTLTGTPEPNAFVVKHDAAGNVLWARMVSTSGITTGVHAYGVAVDGSGNCFISGGFTGTFTFAGTTHTSAGLGDLFIAKYDGSGNEVWAIRGGGADQDMIWAITTDGPGNCYATGHFTGTATFGATTLTATGQLDILVIKLNSAGIVQWARKGGGINHDNSFGIAADDNGNCLITGYCDGTGTFGNITLTANPAHVTIAVTVKYNAAGIPVWASKSGGGHAAYGHNVALDDSGNSYVLGQYWGLVSFDNLPPHPNAQNGYNDLFLVKYNTLGNAVWSRNISGPVREVTGGLAVDADGDIIVAGTFEGTVDISGVGLTASAAGNIFLAKYNTTGSLVWPNIIPRAVWSG